MKNKLLLLIILGAGQAHAAEYPLKNHSAFAGHDAAHNPFWPIGWTKSATSTAAPDQSVATLKADNFIVTTLMLNEPPLAVINGKSMAEGEVLMMTIDDAKVAVQLAAVQDGQVVLRYRDQTIVVPLRRRGEAPRTAAR